MGKKKEKIKELRQTIREKQNMITDQFKIIENLRNRNLLINKLITYIRGNGNCPPEILCKNAKGYCFKCWVDYFSNNRHDTIFGRVV